MPRWLLPAFMAAAVVFFVAFFLLQTAQAPPPKLRIGLLPVVDALPFIVAEKEGLFEKEGLSVELVYFGSARDRDSAIMGGQVDAALHDPVGALMLIGNGVPIKIVGFLCCAGEGDSNVGFYYVKAPGRRR